MSNKTYFSKINDGLGDRYVKDEDARLNISSIEGRLAALENPGYEIVVTKPEPSASTMGKIYLIDKTEGVYERWITVLNSGTYEWIQLSDLGNIDLFNYYTKEQTDSAISTTLNTAIDNVVTALEEGDIIPAMAETLSPWADQKALVEDTYQDVVRTSGGDIPLMTSYGVKSKTIVPKPTKKWTADMLFNGSYNMLNAAKWGAANSQPYVGGVGSDFAYFLVPTLTLGTFGTAEENNGILFTNSDGEDLGGGNVYFKPLGSTYPQSLNDGTLLTPTTVNYDGATYAVYETTEAGWLIVPRDYYDYDICAHIAWEDWYNKYVSLDEPDTNPEAQVGALVLSSFLNLVTTDGYLRGVNEEVNDHIVFEATKAIGYRMVDETSIAANAWTNAATGETDSQGNALYRHSATVSAMKQGGAACIKDGVQLTVNGNVVSYIDTNATAPASVVFYQIPTTAVVEKAYTDNVFSDSNIGAETGVLPINDCSIEAQVGADGEAYITNEYAKNIADQVAINATVDVPQIQKQVENHEERIVKLEDTAVRTGSYDASVAVGLADNFKGDTIVEAEFYKRKTGGTQSVGSGIAAIKEIRGKSIVWNQLITDGNSLYQNWSISQIYGSIVVDNNMITVTLAQKNASARIEYGNYSAFIKTHKYYGSAYINPPKDTMADLFIGYPSSQKSLVANKWNRMSTFINTPNKITEVSVRFNRTKTLDVGDIVQIKNIFFVDLTLMFGAGNEPATVEEFEKMFPLDYYDYNEGTIIPFAGQNLVTIGKNQYNPTSGKANLLGGQTYQLLGTYTSAEIDGVVVTLDSNNCFTTTNDCVLEIAGGNDTDTFVGLYNSETNTFEPYTKHTLPLDPSQWRDKQGNLVFPYGGMHGVGTAYDYAKVDADGYIRSVVRCFGQVNLGSLIWTYSTQKYRFDFVDNNNILKMAVGGTWVKGRIINPKYTTTTVGYLNSDTTSYDKLIATWRGSSANYISIRDLSYTDATTFKAAINGVPLIYELAEPVEVELATPVYAKYLVDKDGTEEITPANGAAPYTTPANLSILYAMDARGEIKNLPKNYLSKESAENMLNAMVSAGVIASYTMTYDATSGRYTFVIVKPQEETPTNAVNNEESI